ncbi:MAG: OmpA family protein, partial [Planctomycetota bacterium]
PEMTEPASETPESESPAAVTVEAEMEAEVIPPAIERPEPTEAATPETAAALEDTGRRDRTADAQAAQRIEDDDDASDLIYSILGGAAAGAIISELSRRNDPVDRPRQVRRLPAEQVGRTRRDREQSVDYFVNRFNGQTGIDDDPRFRNQRRDVPPRAVRRPTYYDGNRRVVRYASRNEIPPILLASQRLDRVEIRPVSEISYLDSRRSVAPEAYRGQGAYGLSYEVDPNSVVSRDDILFKQGSTAFADAYSYDIVADLADAMLSSQLRGAQFVIEGHASAEGSYANNLTLSQERAERIARDLVNYGVSPNRLLPVGYGESEAQFPAEADDRLRSLDRRVMVFKTR